MLGHFGSLSQDYDSITALFQPLADVCVYEDPTNAVSLAKTHKNGDGCWLCKFKIF